MKLFLTSLFILLITKASLAQKINFKEFIPAGFTILDTSKCDLNQDGYTDYIIILKNDLENSVPDTSRPLLIVEGEKNGTFKLIANNDKIVLCYACGGAFGDPYTGITVKDNYFSIEHYGGSSWRWTRIITFKYDKKLNDYILHKDTGESFSVEDLNKREFQTYNKNLWNKVEFKNYNSDW